MPSLLARRNRCVRRSCLPSGSGLPPHSAESASASPFSRPAQHSLVLRPACSPSHPAVTLYIEGSVEFVASLDAPIATGWSDSCRAGFSPAGDVRLFTAHRIIKASRAGDGDSQRLVAAEPLTPRTREGGGRWISRPPDCLGTAMRVE